MTPSPRYHLRLLRGFELRHGDEVLSLPMSAQRLAAFLALRDRRVQRVHVAGTLWIDSSEEQARARLRTALWRLGQAGPEIVHRTSTCIGLSPAVPVDSHEIAARAQRILDGGPQEVDDFRLLAAAGELLPDWYDDWIVVERERLRQLCLHALERMSADATARGELSQAIEAGLAAVALDPLRESAHRVVINAHLAGRNASEAIVQYQLYRHFTQTQLGLLPSGEYMS